MFQVHLESLKKDLSLLKAARVLFLTMLDLVMPRRTCTQLLDGNFPVDFLTIDRHFWCQWFSDPFGEALASADMEFPVVVATF